MRVAFRADASVAIGTGHLMRCLTLAEALTAHGATCTLFARHITDNLAVAVAARGVSLHRLPPAPPGQDELAHSVWLGTSMAEDAAAVAPRLAALDPDWLVLDHYALDARWTTNVRGRARVLVLDDLADRRHEADLLLDSTEGRLAGAYDDLLPPGTPRLIGPMAAVLRSAFAEGAPTFRLRARTRPERVLVAMGGIDSANATGGVIEVLAAKGLAMDVVMGSAAPNLEAVRAQIAGVPGARLHVDTLHMAEIMAGCDLAVGAAGSSAWERCAMGLPTLMLVLAENQREVARGLTDAGAAALLGDVRDSLWPSRLSQALEDVDLPRMSAAAGALTDGRGTVRLTRAMAGLPRLNLRPATDADAEAVWHWRHSGGAHRHYRNAVPVSLTDHRAWFARALDDPARCLFMLEEDGTPVLHVRLDLKPESAAVSVAAAREAQGRGLAGLGLAMAMAYHAAQHAGPLSFAAEVHPDNPASRRLFAGLGFRQTGPGNPFFSYHLPWRQ